MTTKAFSKGEAIRFGWDAMKTHLGFFIGLLVVALVITLIPEIPRSMTAEEAPILSFLFGIVASIVQMILGMGLITVSLKVVDMTKPDLGDLFSRANLFFKYLGGSILFGLITLGGLILLIVPGIVWALKFQFFSYFIIDKGLGPIEALKKSAAITMGAKWNLLLFALLVTGINMLGALALLIGLFATIPTSMVAYAFVYRRLLARTDAAQPPVTA
jgi:uncharacterized membrane protein